MLKQRSRKYRIAVAKEPPLVGPYLVRRSPNRSASSGATAGAVEVTGFIVEGQFFRFKEPLKVKVQEMDGLWVHRYDPLGMMVYAKTPEESRQALAEHFYSDWKAYALEDDQRLTPGAKQLKRQLLEMVESVEQIS